MYVLTGFAAKIAHVAMSVSSPRTPETRVQTFVKQQHRFIGPLEIYPDMAELIYSSRQFVH
jgi:hypothetical protein